MGNFGVGEMLFIGVIALLLFGPSRLPEISRTVGKAVREFKQATNGLAQPLTQLKSEWAAVTDLRPHPAPTPPSAIAVPSAPAPGSLAVATPNEPDELERPERAS